MVSETELSPPLSKQKVKYMLRHMGLKRGGLKRIGHYGVIVTVHNLDGTKLRRFFHSSDELIGFLFDKSLSHSISGLGMEKWILYFKLVENMNNSETNMDGWFIDWVSNIHYLGEEAPVYYKVSGI